MTSKSPDQPHFELNKLPSEFDLAKDDPWQIITACTKRLGYQDSDPEMEKLAQAWDLTKQQYQRLDKQKEGIKPQFHDHNHAYKTAAMVALVLTGGNQVGQDREVIGFTKEEFMETVTAALWHDIAYSLDLTKDYGLEEPEKRKLQELDAESRTAEVFRTAIAPIHVSLSAKAAATELAEVFNPDQIKWIQECIGWTDFSRQHPYWQLQDVVHDNRKILFRIVKVCDMLVTTISGDSNYYQSQMAKLANETVQTKHKPPLSTDTFSDVLTAKLALQAKITSFLNAGLIAYPIKDEAGKVISYGCFDFLNKNLQGVKEILSYLDGIFLNPNKNFYRQRYDQIAADGINKQREMFGHINVEGRSNGDSYNVDPQRQNQALQVELKRMVFLDQELKDSVKKMNRTKQGL